MTNMVYYIQLANLCNLHWLSAGTPAKKVEVPCVLTDATVLAIPPDGNSIKNVCMRRWNELQPRGQGLASEFEEYFEALSDSDKKPFKKEMRIIQLANRKAKAITKTTVNPTPAN
ncbi:hypothetical protein EDB89DRAFT_1910206 [Lactarius sanguifluus]|nr:hypothetical protein EDB89DRAFT_1910206 [Lactarius sanguifluus]